MKNLDSQQTLTMTHVAERKKRYPTFEGEVAALGLDEAFTQTLSSADVGAIEALPVGLTHHIINKQRMNDVQKLNEYFEAINKRLPEGGYFIGETETSEQRKRRIFNKYPRWFAWLYYDFDFVFKRAFPKLKPTRWLYMALTKGRNWVLTDAEILGRLAYCGFKIIHHREQDNRLRFIVQKAGEPTHDPLPSEGIIFKMNRYGKGGRIFRIYKLRTMHPYATYLQDYVYELNQLAEGGKFKNDFRVTYWARLLRKTFLDEVPMLINVLKGELKLVGVRPLSEQYRQLYRADLIEKREKYKPGLMPPFYVDMPKSLLEIQASEEKYLDAYEAHPLRTDLRYFFKIWYNLLFKRARSH